MSLVPRLWEPLPRGWNGWRAGAEVSFGLTRHWEEGVVSILLNWVLPFDPCPDPGHSLPGAWKPRGSWSGESLNMSFPNKGLGLIHHLLDLGWKVNINPSGRLEPGLRNCAHLGSGSLQPGSAASGAAPSGSPGSVRRPLQTSALGLPGPGPQARLCCAWARRPLATPPALRGGRCPTGAPGSAPVPKRILGGK